MKYWYHGECFRVFPNIEVYKDKDLNLYEFTFAWMKFVIDLPICIKL